MSTREAVARGRVRNPTVRAYVSTRFDAALRDDERLADETPRSALHGVPFGLKDQWETTSLPTTGGSHRHRDRRSPDDSAVFSTFAEAGAVLIGKTNLSDLGIPPEATSYVGGATRTPRFLDRTAGGSSGGAAAAVADGMAAFDWGTDIGGSIRLPAAFCGVLGLRLSSETWPITGMFPRLPRGLAWMCGQGPITNTIDEMRAVLDVARPRLRHAAGSRFDVRKIVTYAPEHAGKWPGFVDEVTPALRDATGLDVEPGRELPRTNWVRNVYASLWASHMEDLLDADDSIGLGEGLAAVLSSILLRGRLGDRRFHPSTAELLGLIALGRVTIFRDPERALSKAQRVRESFESHWAHGAVIAAPVCVYPPPHVGRGTRNLHLLSCTFPGNIADATGLSIPFGTFDGLPRSVQLMGPPGSEGVLLDLADRIVAARAEAARDGGG